MAPTNQAKSPAEERAEADAARKRDDYGRALGEELEGLERRASAGDDQAKRRVGEVKAELKRIGVKPKGRDSDDPALTMAAPSPSGQPVPPPPVVDGPTVEHQAPTDPAVAPDAAAKADADNTQAKPPAKTATAKTAKSTPAKATPAKGK